VAHEGASDQPGGWLGHANARKRSLLNSQAWATRPGADADELVVPRYNPDGPLDATSGPRGIVMTDFTGRDDFIRSIAVQPDGRIVVVAGGDAWDDTESKRVLAIARYNADGSLDTSFDTDGRQTLAVGTGNALAIQGAEKGATLFERHWGVKPERSIMNNRAEFFLNRHFDAGVFDICNVRRNRVEANKDYTILITSPKDAYWSTMPDLEVRNAVELEIQLLMR
jgi:uncharacterized delta-60 repeat protein